MQTDRDRLVCSRCDKKLTRKTARQIEGKLLCSACLFPATKGGLPQPRSSK
jgi:formylmethanofuran dehydrogenase subunit E